MNSTTAIIKANNLSKHVVSPEGDLTILHDINFTIQPGEVVAVVGASGSGKSTLLGILAGLDNPSEGEVYLAGHNLSQLNEDARAALRASAIGFVFQAFHLLPNLTALENVMLPLELAQRNSARTSALDILERVGLGPRVQHYPKQLSGGEQQRVAIARAFVVAPQILFADEPTGSLDKLTGEKVIDLLFRLNQETHTTMILVTHDEKLAARCHRQLVLDSGKLVSQ